VKDFQPYYVFNTRKMAYLRIGAAILKEAIDLETQKQECLQRSKEEQKAAAAAVTQNARFIGVSLEFDILNHDLRSSWRF
jgi:hypothetical protein